jgi:hypothetical protein
MPWASRRLRLYHGTIGPYADDIQNAVKLTKCAVGSDFGPGFYMTRIYDQAVAFANKRYDDALDSHTRHPANFADPVCAAIVEFTIVLDGLGGLDNLAFVQPTSDWLEFVRFCRAGALAHKASGKCYDVVYGPCWASGAGAIPDWEQLSLHSDYGVSLLQLQDIRRGGARL